MSEPITCRDGGLVIGSHSIANDISQERYQLFIDILCQRGRPEPGSWVPARAARVIHTHSVA